MHFKALIIAALSFTSICSASMHHEEKYVNKSVPVLLHEVQFRTDGMFLVKDGFYELRLSKLINEGNDYLAFYRIDFVCGNCLIIYSTDPGICEVCGSSNIRERDRPLANWIKIA